MKKRLSISLDADVADYVDTVAAEKRITMAAFINSTLASIMQATGYQPADKPRRKRAPAAK